MEPVVQPAYEVDGLPAAPERFYATACDPARSVVVEACAGAGKTWMLVARMLRALLEGTPPGQILAITFTRKAAGEMQSRLDELLRTLAFASLVAREEALQQRGMTPGQARAAAPALAALYGRVLAAGHGVQVHTFHSWFAQLMRAAPLDLLAGLGVPPDAELVEEVDDLLPATWQALLARAERDAALQADLAAQVRLHGQRSLRAWLQHAVSQRIEIELADRAGTLEPSVPAVNLHGLSHPAQELDAAGWRAALNDLAAELGRSTRSKARAAAWHIERAWAEPDAPRRFQALWSALFTEEGKPRQLGESVALAAAQAGLENVATRIAQHEARAEHLRMVRLSRVLLQGYAALKRQRGVADMADLERVALALLRDAPAAAWVQERLDLRYRHILIDEFQDTSPLQWQALHAWLSGYSGAGGGASGHHAPGVFIVGDPKQSVYRFRRAEPRVFAAARRFVAEGLGGHVLSCDHTRRNAAQVLDRVNATFAGLQARGGYAGFRPHTTSAGDPGEVRRLPPVLRPLRVAAQQTEAWRDTLGTPRVVIEEALRDREARGVALAVAELLSQGVPPGQIHVLARRRVALAPVARALAARGIAHALPEARPLREGWVARDLIALLDVLASTHHDLSLAQALKSPLFGATDADLTRLAAANASDWWQALQSDAAAGASPVLRDARERLRRWHGWSRELPPHDLLQRIADDADLHARYAAAVDATEVDDTLEQIDAVLEQALRLGGARYATPYGFVRALRRQSVPLPPAPHPHAVQLLTVHGAKGLEADVVFLVDAAAARPRADTLGLLVEWPVEATAPRRCAFVASEARCPPALRGLLEAERAERAREECNALYVAMTRARRLLVFSHVEPRGGRLDDTWWGVAGAQEAVPWHPRPGEEPATGAVQPHVLYTLPVPARPQGGGAPDGTPARAPVDAAVGIAVHRCLEWLTPLPRPQRDSRTVERAVQHACRQCGVPVTAQSRVAHVVGKVLASDALAPLLDPERAAWAGNEVGLAWQGEALRIDRLVAVDTPQGRCWWVLDYKLQHAPAELPAYREQLARYREAVRAGCGGAIVRAAFVTGDAALVELQPD